MMADMPACLAAILGVWLCAAAYPSPAGAADQRPDPVIHLESEPIQPLEKPVGLDPRRVALGSRLFNDKRLSKNNSISCATCHDLQQGATTHTAQSLPGVSGKNIPLNIPSVIGSGLNFAQFWNGRAGTLEEQIDGPTQHVDEMGDTWPDMIEKLAADPGYSQSFMAIYQSPPTHESIKNALATFERSLVYTDSPFDRYLRGDGGAISPDAKAGYQLFKSFGCSSCHQGRNVGGNMFQKFGIVEDYFAKRGHITEEDYGRYNVTHDENDRYYFKVPSLRNIALTAPYFHDGSAKTLDDAVDTMATYQLGRTVSPDERAKLVAFLTSLTGKPPADPDPVSASHE
jgi:cytochrome c peroxidase